MKIFLLASVLFSTFAYGQQPHVYVNGAGDKWYSARELEQIGRDHVKERKIQFSLVGTKMIVWVKSCSYYVLSIVSFGCGVCSSILIVDIDRHGKVITNYAGAAARRHVGSPEMGDPGNSQVSRTNRMNRTPR